MVEHKFVLFATFKGFLNPCNFTNKANWHTSKVEIHTRSKLCHFCWPLCCESEAILFKKFRPGHWAGMFIWENFHPGNRDLGRKNRDLGNRDSLASHMNTSIFLQRKEREARSQKPSQPGWPGSYEHINIFTKKSRRGEISETDPARLTGLIWRGPKNVVFLAQAEYSYFSASFRLKIFFNLVLFFKRYSLWHFRFRIYWGIYYKCLVSGSISRYIVHMLHRFSL